ncbi:hypothetical protein [Bradyrhizobium septentrionale]|uniref:Uncharacterized protein n=1 Tax=Bradyrhizobium septentrionale TaxID=1404411 RepID=A0ABZ2NT60_9BRAD
MIDRDQGFSAEPQRNDPAPRSKCRNTPVEGARSGRYAARAVLGRENSPDISRTKYLDISHAKYITTA